MDNNTFKDNIIAKENTNTIENTACKEKDNYNESSNEKVGFFKKIYYSIFKISKADNIILENNNSHKWYISIIIIICALIPALCIALVNKINRDNVMSKISKSNTYSIIQEEGIEGLRNNEIQEKIELDDVDIIVDTRNIIEETKKDEEKDRPSLVIGRDKFSFIDNTGEYSHDITDPKEIALLTSIFKITLNHFFILFVNFIMIYLSILVVYIVIFKTVGTLLISLFSSTTDFSLTKQNISKITTYSATLPIIMISILASISVLFNVGIPSIFLAAFFVYLVYNVLMFLSFRKKIESKEVQVGV